MAAAAPAGAGGTPYNKSSLQLEDRAILWEVNIARHCVESFSKIINAQAVVMSLLLTASLTGFLQPPKGWQTGVPDVRHSFLGPDHTGVFMFDNSPSLDAFAFFNSLSLFTAIAGLLFYVYCSYATIMTFGTVPLPDKFDYAELQSLRRLRTALRKVALVSVRRRSVLMFACLVSSLTFCMAAYMSGGVAALRPGSRFKYLILPSLPGSCLSIILLLVVVCKIRLEVNFDKRLNAFWKMTQDPANMSHPTIEPPLLVRLDPELLQALDPVPSFVQWAVNKIFPVNDDDDYEVHSSHNPN